MIRLDTTTRKLQLLLGGAVTANELPITCCYSDKTATTYNGATTVSTSNGTTAVDIVAAPAASTMRDIDLVDVRNRDTAAATVTVRYNDNGTTYEMIKVTLQPNDYMTYTHAAGWKVYDSTGAQKTVSSAGGIVLRTTGTGFATLPVGPASPVAITEGTSSAYGSYAQIVASTATAIYIVGFSGEITNAAITSEIMHQIALGIGAAASETIVGEWAVGGISTSAGTFPFEVTLPYPIPVPISTRIAVKAATNSLSSATLFYLVLNVINQSNILTS